MNDLILKFPSFTILKGDTPEATAHFDSLIPDPKSKINKYTFYKYPIQIPENFEGKKVWKRYLSQVFNQRQCGGCWAFASCSSLADRFNIQSLGGFNLTLSPVKVILCDTQGSAFIPSILDNSSKGDFAKFYKSITDKYGCYGNTLSEAWRYLYVLGTNTIECIPLDILQSKSDCPNVSGEVYDLCVNKQPARFYNAEHIYAIVNNEEEIRKEIYKWGPVSSAMEVYPDLYTFDPKREIYKWNGQGTRVGGHAVVIDGWGVENGVKFWWIRNSWGKDWGIDGYFKMVRGINECKLEENVITGIPNIHFSPVSYGTGIFQEREIDAQHKIRIHDVSWFGGGIDPHTGYTRRHLSNLTVAENLSFQKFPALVGEKFAAGVEETPTTTTLSTSTTTIVFFTILLFILCVIVIMY